ncbi:MAG: hypothetical protein U0359_06400 [Byssovorax sp.]
MSRSSVRLARGPVLALILAVSSAASADLVPGPGRLAAPPPTGRPAPAATLILPPGAGSAAASAAASASAAPAASAAAPAAPSASAAAPPPPAPAAPVASGSAMPAPSASAPPSRDDLCADTVITWAKGASQRTGLTIAPVSCSPGIVRLSVAGAGCDFEVARGKGFQRTTDGTFGVSPIANLDWASAPEPMKKALAGLLTALSQDGSLLIPSGDPIYNADAGRFLGSRQNQILAGVAALLALGGVGFWLKKKKPA